MISYQSYFLSIWMLVLPCKNCLLQIHDWRLQPFANFCSHKIVSNISDIRKWTFPEESLRTVCFSCHWMVLRFLKIDFNLLCPVDRCIITLINSFITKPTSGWWISSPTGDVFYFNSVTHPFTGMASIHYHLILGRCRCRIETTFIQEFMAAVLWSLEGHFLLFKH